MADPFEIRHRQLLIGGVWADGADRERAKLINPATEEPLCEVAMGAIPDVERAVKSATDALHGKDYRKMGGQGRGRALFKLADLIDRDLPEIARLETLNQGKPIFESAKIDVPFVASLLRYYAGWADKLNGDTLPTHPGFLTYTLREPVGVVGAIIPWNFPLLLTVWKLAPALAAGCTLVIKPSELTPLSALKLGALCLEAGFPPGVVNVVPGGGTVVGQAMIDSPGIHKITFTGSTETGKGVMRGAADTLKRLTLELGGKSPNIVFADADLDKAAQGACGGIFYNKGEVCAAGSRLFVEKKIEAEFLDLLGTKMERYRPGDPLDDKTRLGPQVSQGHRESILKAIAGGRAEGAKIFRGGNATAINGRGYFVEPTILHGVRNSMKVAREEIFGPVLAVIPFENEETLLEESNDSPFGLAAGIWTRDIGRAHRMAAQIKAGTVWVNCYNTYHPQAGFGGFKQSGFGRELGREALDGYLESKTVWVAHG